jgi:DNA primase
MTIPEDIIERVRLSNNIELVVREFLPNLKRSGRNWKACCPFHNEKTPSFVVSPDKGIFRCFGCNVAGDVFKFVMLVDNISWIESVKKLAKKANITIQETKQDIVKTSQKAKLFDILDSSATFYHKYLLESASASKARDYLKQRGIACETLNKFKIGFAPYGQLLQHLMKKGCTIEDVLKAGLLAKSATGNFFEYMSERVVFPIFDVQGKVVAFGGRTITNQDPKYLNTPETIVYSKSSNLYGLFQTLPDIRKERKIIVLEGYMDVVICQQFGITGAVASLGTAFTQNHARLISRYSDATTLLFDSDNAGRAATQRALEILIENGIETKVSALPENVDADEYLIRYGKENFLKLLKDSSQSAIDFIIARIQGLLSLKGKKDSPEIKARAISNLLDFVSKSSNAIIQREWIKNISQYVNVDEESVCKEFKKRKKLRLQGYQGSSLESLTPSVIKNKTVSMSLEENLLNLILSNRDYIEKVDINYFKDSRCENVFGLLRSGLSDAEILSQLSQKDVNWFSELTLNAIEYDNIKEAFRIILRDIEFDMLKKKRQLLEKEILLMSQGKKEKDVKMFDEYKELTALIKGSGK